MVFWKPAAVAPSYAMALLSAQSPGLRDRLLNTALAATVSLLQPRYYGPLCNFSRIEGGSFVPLGVEGAWVCFAPSDASQLHFRLVAGLASARDVSIESLGSPPLYLRALQSRLVPCPYEDDSGSGRLRPFIWCAGWPIREASRCAPTSRHRATSSPPTSPGMGPTARWRSSTSTSGPGARAARGQLSRLGHLLPGDRAASPPQERAPSCAWASGC